MDKLTGNNERKQPAAEEVPKKDRLKVAVIAMEDNKKLHEMDKTGKRGSSNLVDQEVIDQIIEDWPKLSQEVTQTMIKFYGLPNEVTNSQVTWFYSGP
jgi:hypothetical protein